MGSIFRLLQFSPSLLLLLLCASIAASQDCSATNLCATGCCSTSGYCGTGSEYCGADVCVSTCDSTATAQCDANNHCSEGCCSKFGVCGYGPDYCSSDNCVSTCDQKSECDPGNWGSTFAESTTCPLNVCCSKYGFCGTTTEFCGTKTVKRPSCSKLSTLSRVVGYYEGWSPQRPCNAIYPEQIPLGIYTHLNYAFASIDPNTFEVIPTYDTDPALYLRLTSLKDQDPDLKVNIAIGGWSFNDPGPTATTFSDLAASEDNQRAFFKSLISFMSTYNFDGVDIDWEYPGASDRSGRAEDFANYPQFIANLKSALSGTGGRDGLSVTLPSSYWYLQNFDVESLSKYVDYFNFMTYDLHGLWDKTNQWTGPFLDSHTNMTEITLDFDLLWRNNVPPQKVVMGLAFYGRGFTVASTSCEEPGCTFSSGSLPGNCSQTISMLMNSEIDDIRAQQSINPILDNDAEVELLYWDDQWITYDDASTLELKTDFAKSECLGGVMVWAVSHDDADGTYSEALSNTTNRPFVSLQQYRSTGDDDPIIYTTTQHPSCRWTGCGEVCPLGYSALSRGDGGAREGELMLDQTGCPSDTVHTLCCPSESPKPTCGWYTHNNGKCDPSCPTGTIEVGSNSMYCNKNYQAACCTIDVDSMKIYTTAQWSEWPNCDQGTCPWSDTSDTILLTNSTTGSGGAKCNLVGYEDTSYGLYGYGNGYNPYTERKLCADTSDSDLSLTSCDWYVDLGITLVAVDPFCSSSCPGDKVRMALDQLDPICYGSGGARSFCCNANYTTQTATVNSDLQIWDTKLGQFMDNGTCPATNMTAPTQLGSLSLLRRGSSGFDGGASSAIQMEYLSMTLAGLLNANILRAIQVDMIATWNNAVRTTFPNLVFSILQPFMQSFTPFIENGAQATAFDLLCRMSVYNEEVGGETVSGCAGSVCDPGYEPDLCLSDDDDSSQPSQKRDNIEIRDPQSRSEQYLEKRGGVETKLYSVYCTTSSTWIDDLSIQSLAFPSQGAWKTTDLVYMNSRDFQDENDCANAAIRTVSKTNDVYNTEHIVELQMIPQFFQSITEGTYLSGATPIEYTPVPCNFFSPTADNVLNTAILAGVPARPNGASQSAASTPGERIMAALGSNNNRGNFYLLRAELNNIKSKIFDTKNKEIIADMATYIADTSDPSHALKFIRDVIAVWAYLNDPDVKQSMVTIANNVRAQLLLTQTVWAGWPGGYQVDLANAWSMWFRDMLTYQADRTNEWVTKQINAMETAWKGQTGPNQVVVTGAIWKLRRQQARFITVNLAGAGLD